MGNCFLKCPGAGSLGGVRIFGGTAQPAKKMDGDIWLETKEPITGYTWTTDIIRDLSALETKGWVIMDGTTNGYKTGVIVKTNTGETRMVPGRCWQYDGEKWIALTFRTWKRGDGWYRYDGWNGKLLDMENQFPEWTSGWIFSSSLDETIAKNLSIYNTAEYDYLKLRMRRYFYIHPGWKKICLEGRAGLDYKGKSVGDGYILFWRWDEEKKKAVYAFKQTVKNEDTVQEFDISGVEKGLYLIGIRGPYASENGNTGNTAVSIKRVWLE